MGVIGSHWTRVHQQFWAWVGEVNVDFTSGDVKVTQTLTCQINASSFPFDETPKATTDNEAKEADDDGNDALYVFMFLTLMLFGNCLLNQALKKFFYQ